MEEFDTIQQDEKFNKYFEFFSVIFFIIFLPGFLVGFLPFLNYKFAEFYYIFMYVIALCLAVNKIFYSKNDNKQ